MKAKIGVYEISCVVTKKVYVGSSKVSIENRFSHHLTKLKDGTHTNTNLMEDWNSLGRSAFAFKIVKECQPEKCLAEEQKRIDKWRKKNLCYNMQPNAGTSKGSRRSDASKANSKAKAKERCNEEWRKAVSERVKAQHSEGKFGRATWSEQTKKEVSEKISNALRGRSNPRPEGWVCSEESRERYRQAALKREAAKKLKQGA